MIDPIRAALERLVELYEVELDELSIESGSGVAWIYAWQAARTALAAEPSAPDPDPSDFQTLQGIALDMVESLRPIVIPEILGTLRRAIREPAACPHIRSNGDSNWCALAEQQAAPEPYQAPAGDGGLLTQVQIAIGGDHWEIREKESRAAILAVAKWLRSWAYKDSAANLEREAQR